MPNKPDPIHKPPRRKNDELLKGAFEEHFVDFLRFLYGNADDLFDVDRGLVFMDKELHAIIPDRERSADKRVADLLVKVYLKNGEEKYILLNTEIEAGSRAEFARRIYQYNYRIWDRYGIPVATIAVFIGNRNQRRPAEYWSQVLDTTISFRYRTYHIFDHREAELLAMDNPFALVVLACQKALLEGKMSDEALGQERLIIAKALLAHNYDHDRILSFLVFLKNFVFINNEEINRIFDMEIDKLTGGTIDMGIIETVKRQERQAGMLEGKLEGKLEGEREKALAIAREMRKDGIPAKQIAKFTKLSIKEIEKLR